MPITHDELKSYLEQIRSQMSVLLERVEIKRHAMHEVQEKINNFVDSSCIAATRAWQVELKALLKELDVCYWGKEASDEYDKDRGQHGLESH
jgi:hypothetical protein